MPLDLAFVLVSPSVPENVGAAARAIKTMGFTQLRIVGSDAHRLHKATILAHGAGDVLAAAQAFDSLEQALADRDIAVATSAKLRHDRRYSLEPAALRTQLASKAGSAPRVALVFGCESSGLSNRELACCDLLTHIPLATTYPSLNLAQAVMLYAWELSGLEGTAEPGAEPGSWRAARQRLQAVMPALGIAPDSPLARWATERLGMAADSDVRFMHLLINALEAHLAGPGDE